MHEIKTYFGGVRNPLRGGLLTALLAAGLVMTPAVLPAQQKNADAVQAALQGLTPEQRQALERLSPSERQAFTEAVMKNGGKVTPELLAQLLQQAGTQPRPAAGQQLTPQENVAVRNEQEMRMHKAEAERKELLFEEKTGRILLSRATTSLGELKLFGLDYFAPARKRILTIEEAIASGKMLPSLQKDALAGFVGPLDMVSTSVNASMPPLYVLNPGDKLTVYYWGDLLELTTVHLELDEQGEVAITKAGKFSARGMTLAQFQSAVKDHLQRVLGKDIKLVATLDRLMSMQILVVGEAFRPGNYAVSSVTTLFNAIYAGGGPNENGSLRDIKLIRKDRTITLDFYDYLMKGDGRLDYPLQAGDTILFGRRQKVASIRGEVHRPAFYELKQGETLRNLVAMANGIKASGLNNKVHIESVVPHRQFAVVDVDMSRDTPSADHDIQDGDSVIVEAVIPEIVNQIVLIGDVKVPGSYELKKNMRLADLFNEVNQPKGDAYLDRVDIVRLNEDRKTTKLISVNLAKALARDPEQNIELAPMDRVIVYAKWDVKSYADPIVTVRGAVQRPGIYPRSEGMRLKDLLLQAGGTLPGRSEEATISKARVLGEAKLITVRLDLLEKGDESQNVLLENEDIVMIREYNDFFEMPQWVEIKGEVRFPGSYPLLRKGYRLSELVKAAGGLTKQANPDGAVFLRLREYLPSAEQNSDLQTINKIMNALNEIDFRRQAARNAVLLQKELGSKEAAQPPVIGAGVPVISSTGTDVKEAVGLGMAPSIAASAGQSTAQIMEAFTPGSGVTSQARTLNPEQLMQSTRIIINLEKGMEGGAENPDNVVLLNGDSVAIPIKTGTASVVGAVLSPATTHLGNHRTVKEMIAIAGGYAKDADREGTLVLRVSGVVEPAKDVDYIQDGDIVYVPTKVMATEIVTTTDKIISAIKFTLTTIASVVVFLALIH